MNNALQSRMGLTHAQSDCLGLIERRMAKDGVAPTFDEMAAHLGLKSKSGVHRILSGLENRGYIRRFPRQARAIELVHSGSVIVCPHCGNPAGSKACRAAANLDRALSNAPLQNTSKTVIAPAANGSAT
jgi:repressor LexA